MKKLFLALLLLGCAEADMVDHVAEPDKIGNPSRFFRYQYGYPTAQSYEPNVKLQFLLDEAASPVVDVVAGHSLPAVIGLGSSITYQNAIPWPLTNLLYATSYVGSGASASGSRHVDATIINELELGANDHFVFEWWGKWDLGYPSAALTGDIIFFEIGRNVGSNGTYGVRVSGNGTDGSSLKIVVRKNTAGTVARRDYEFPVSTYQDGKYHHYRILGNRYGNLGFEVDGNSKTETTGNADLTWFQGPLSVSVLALGGQNTFGAGGSSTQVSIAEFRASIGPDVRNNSSYPRFHCGTPNRF